MTVLRSPALTSLYETPMISSSLLGCSHIVIGLGFKKEMRQGTEASLTHREAPGNYSWHYYKENNAWQKRAIPETQLQVGMSPNVSLSANDSGLVLEASEDTQICRNVVQHKCSL